MPYNFALVTTLYLTRPYFSSFRIKYNFASDTSPLLISFYLNEHHHHAINYFSSLYFKDSNLYQHTFHCFMLNSGQGRRSHRYTNQVVGSNVFISNAVLRFNVKCSW